MILDAIALLLIAFAAINVTSTLVLVRAALRHHWPALRERAAIAVILAAIAIGFALLGGHRLHLLNLPSDVSLAILALGLMLVSVPSIIWAIAYWTGRFDDPDSSGGSGRP